MQDLGVYISVPFCKAKCTFCNFASDAFAPGRMDSYVDCLCQEIGAARSSTTTHGAQLPDRLDTLYFGGGTPSLLGPGHIRQIFAALRQQFTFESGAELTLECAPGQLSDATLAELQQQGLNRVSLGVQSFNDRESAAIGRLHTRQMCLDEIARLGAAGVGNIGLDLIAGLPHQTQQSWMESLDTAITSGVQHLSLYMLEVDEDSRLGREMLSSGSRYSAATVPTDDDTADWYLFACRHLADAGVHQYEISNFARTGYRSRHNLKYWHRAPYIGFGLDAHSMLPTATTVVRFSNTSELDLYSPAAESFRSQTHNALPLYPSSAPAAIPAANPTAMPAREVDRLTREQILEESLFLGLRLNEGVDLSRLQEHFGEAMMHQFTPAIREVTEAGLVVQTEQTLALTERGRIVSNEVFSRLLIATPI